MSFSPRQFIRTVPFDRLFDDWSSLKYNSANNANQIDLDVMCCHICGRCLAKFNVRHPFPLCSCEFSSPIVITRADVLVMRGLCREIFPLRKMASSLICPLILRYIQIWARGLAHYVTFKRTSILEMKESVVNKALACRYGPLWPYRSTHSHTFKMFKSCWMKTSCSSLPYLFG